MNSQPDSRNWQPSEPGPQEGQPGSDDDRGPLFQDRYTYPVEQSPPPADTKFTLWDRVWLVGVCGGLLALIVGCCFGVRWVMDPNGGKGTPIPQDVQATVPSPPWTPSSGGVREVEDKLRYALEQRTLEAAGVDGPISSTCEYGNPLPAKCTVEYRGFTMQWNITHISGVVVVIKYEAHTSLIVVTRDGIHAAFAKQFQHSYELRCEKLPEIALVPVGKPLDPACYEQTERKGPSDQLNIVPSDQGPVHFEAD